VLYVNMYEIVTPGTPPLPSSTEPNFLIHRANEIIKALAVNPNQYNSDDFFWNGSIVTEHSSHNLRCLKQRWLKERGKYLYTAVELQQKGNIEQGVIASKLRSQDWTWASLECMFGRGRNYIKGRISEAENDDIHHNELEKLATTKKRKDESKKEENKRKKRRKERFSLPDYSEEYKCCSNDDQRYCLLKRIESQYATNPPVELPNSVTYLKPRKLFSMVIHRKICLVEA